MWACCDGVCSWCRTRSSCGEIVQSVWQCFSPGTEAPCNALVYQGLALAAGAALLYGACPALARMAAVRKVPSHVFSLWMCTGIVLLGAPIAYGTRLRCVSPASGLLLVVSLAAGVESLHALGLLQATGIMCGTAALSVLALGSAVQPGLVSSWPLAAAGAACLLAGMLLVAWAGRLVQQSSAAQAVSPSSTTAGQPAAGRVTESTLQQPLLQADGAGTPSLAAAEGPVLPQHLTGRHPRYARLAGWACAAAAGAIMAAVLVLAPGRECWGWPFLAGLSTGVLPAAPVLALCLHWAHTGKVGWLPLQPAAAALPGMAAGILFASAVACCLLAAAVLGLASAFLIMQSGLLVAGMGGMLLLCFSEPNSLRPCLVWCSGGCALLAGLFLLVRASGVTFAATS